ncbi:MAG: GAF domain-containing protein [Tissierellia bacterium]|nr:GAF domain-containing protein [Tissierellia bacterium]
MIKLKGLEKMSKAQRLAYTKLLLRSQGGTESHPRAIEANAAAIIMAVVEGLNWAGFYWVVEDELVLGSFQGLPACTRISYGKGVCGSAWKENCSQRVEDVENFPGHIACDSASRSELVIPIRKSGELRGVLDLDSPYLGHFTQQDQVAFEEFVEILEGFLYD